MNLNREGQAVPRKAVNVARVQYEIPSKAVIINRYS